jgi:hypothetical protein
MVMASRSLILVCLLALAGPGLAQVGNKAGSDDRWNVTGPAWYDTKCGHIGFSVTHGLPYANSWRQPCSVPIRVCEYKSMTINYPADPDVPCEKMVNPATAGELQRTYMKRWD